MSAASSSPAPSPQSAAARNPRVCLNCRRRKKGCNKALPSCRRCIDSLQVCQYEEDVGPSQPGPFPLPLSPVQPAGHRWAALNLNIFGSMDEGEDIHSYTHRSLFEVLESHPNVDYFVSRYFEDVNIWFAIVDRSVFETQLKEFWIKPSAQIGALVLCMHLITRQHTNPIVGMSDSLYLHAKLMLSAVQSKTTFSIPMLQAQLLLALYESSHSMPQQAYMTVGNCCQISQAFGWHTKGFWSEQRRNMAPRELQHCSILWWAIVYLDCMVHVGYQEHKYPLHTATLGSDVTVPFPEAFDELIAAASSTMFHSPGGSPGGRFGSWDSTTSQTGGMIWPEAQSAYYLSSVLQQLSSQSPVATAERDRISEMIMTHTINLLSCNRTAAVGLNFIALMKINQPGLLAGASMLPVPGPTDTRPIETIQHVIDSIYAAAMNLESAPHLSHGNNVAPCGPFAAYYAALLLISHGGGILQDPEWLHKVESLKKYLGFFSMRWKVAEKYLESTNLAQNTRLRDMMPR